MIQAVKLLSLKINQLMYYKSIFLFFRRPYLLILFTELNLSI